MKHHTTLYLRPKPSNPQQIEPTRYKSTLHRWLQRSLFASLFVVLGVGSSAYAAETLLHVSYDPTRELFEDFNQAFQAHYQKEKGKSISIRQSHGGSGKQARAVIDGLKADIVSLALASDIDYLNLRQPLVSPNWREKFPNHSVPFSSTIVFLVRKGNPKGIKDWDYLIKPDVKIITANPKTSGAARWSFLAAYGHALQKYQGDEEQARKYVTEFYRHAPVLDAGARGSTVTFVQNEIGDVLVSWENEAYLAAQRAPEKVEIVVPPRSIKAEPPVAIVDRVVDRQGTREVAEDYLNYLYTDTGQRIAAKHFYRPVSPQIFAEFKQTFAPLELFSIEDTFGSWDKVNTRFFKQNALFDQIYREINQ